MPKKYRPIPKFHQDVFGKDVIPRDILLENTGSSGDMQRIRVWEIPENYCGLGYEYDITGKKHSFAWARVGDSMVLHKSDMPLGFEYSFKHGMNTIYSSIGEGEPKEIIENSDWEDRLISQDDLKLYDFLKNIEVTSKKHIIELIELLYKRDRVCTIPYSFIVRVMDTLGYLKRPIRETKHYSIIMLDLVFMEIVRKVLTKQVDVL